MSKNKKVAQLQCAQPIQTQPATLEDKSATPGATTCATSSLKPLALKVLSLNRQRNISATGKPEVRNSLRNSEDENCNQLQKKCNHSKRAKGYGCAGCGCRTYRQVVNGWQCEGCGTVFMLIGGSSGPMVIQ